MTLRWSSSSQLMRAALIGGCLAAVAAMSGAEGGFSATLSDEQRTNSGLATLSPTERSTLDLLVANDLAQIRQDVGAASGGTFSSRQSAEQRKAAGLDHLSPAQLTSLNELVASALVITPKPKVRPRLKDDEVIRPQKVELHGSVSLTLGWAKNGGSFRGTSFSVDYFDPNTGLGIGVGIDTFKGNGLLGYYPGYGSRYADFGAGPYNPFYYGGLRDDFYDSSLRGSTAWDAAARRDYRRR